MRYSTFFFYTLFILIAYTHAEEQRSGTISSDETWLKENSPYLITGNVTVDEGVSVTIEAGVEVRLGPSVRITVNGELNANGSVDENIQFVPNQNNRWGALVYENNASGTLNHCFFTRGSNGGSGRSGVVTAYRCAGPVVVQDCTFTDWNSNATESYYIPDMTIRRCYFGTGANEPVHGTGSPVLVEYCTFDRRIGYNDAIDVTANFKPDPVPVIRKNVFLGGDDDAIDLDDCDAFVDGNLVMNFRGGDNDPIGISGDRNTNPTLVNNLIINCETGIGFKNGADITVINNTIIDCDKGIWLHQDPARATVLNTLIWGQEDQVGIQLEPGSTIDIQYSLIRGNSVYPGEGNINGAPMFVDPANRIFKLLPGSPAINAGIKTEPVPDWDFYDIARDQPDIGAFEYQPLETLIQYWLNH